MKILIVGQGGREHAFAWKLAQSEKISNIFVAPGNAGTALTAKTENVAIENTNIAALIEFAKHQAIDLTLVGPEAPLALGIVDQFQAANLVCLGPTQQAAQLESSKVFCKNFLQKYAIPTAKYATFMDSQAALVYLQQQSFPMVIKADGLAAGKGVVIAQDYQQGAAAVCAMLDDNRFGAASQRIVIEDFLEGEEVSFIVVCDGKTILPLASSQDHKARDDGDSGPNTGGMGAYSPAPLVTSAIHGRIMREIIEPTVRALKQEGIDYVGFLYAGLMITQNAEIKVLEYNCRLGDPETQPIMLRLQSDFFALCQATVQQRLSQYAVAWDPRPALGVVLASQGYPDDYTQDQPITGLAISFKNGTVFHAGTQQHERQIYTCGGRVLCVCALGDTVQKAQEYVYEHIKHIHWEGMFYRHDIGYRAIKRELNYA